MLNDKEILAEARTRYDHCNTMWGEFKQRATELLTFISGDQWTQPARQSFENAGFTAMTSNRIPGFLRQITNELRKNTPAIQIDPRKDEDSEKAEILNDLLRNVQDESMAEVAYCKAAESAASIGIGYIRVTSKYKDNNSFDQELSIDAVEDAISVMVDPNHKSLTGSDCEYGFITTVLSRQEYQTRYGGSKLSRKIDGTMSDAEWKEIGWTGSDTKWVSNDQVLINEYYFKDYKEETLYQIRDFMGTVSSTMDKNVAKAEGTTIIQTRELNVPIVRWCKLNDLEVLEESEWPGCYIPIIIVKGDEFWLEGKRKLVGAVEPAIEAQVQLNYAMSWRAQLLQMAPKAPYIGTAAQFKTYEQEWANINVSNQAFMVYNKDEGAPPPGRDLGEVPIQSASVLVNNSVEDLRAIFGTFDPSQQAAGPESGKALLARQDQSYNSNYHFYDNLARSLEHLGLICVEAVPVIYDTARDIQVKSQDGKKRTISINQPNTYGVVEYDFTVGEYSLSIQTGASFGTRKQESSDQIMNLIGVYPESANAIADLAVRNMTWPGADKIADSLEAMVPMQVLEARKTNPKDAAALVPQLQAQVAQYKQQMEVLTMNLKQATEKLQDKSDTLQIEHLKADTTNKKTDSETSIKMRTLDIEEQKTELEFYVKETELKIAEETLALKKAELGIKGAVVLSDMNDSMHERHKSHIASASSTVAVPDIDDITTGLSGRELE